MKRDAGDFVDDIIEAAERIMRFVEGMDYTEFMRDDKTVFAVIRGIEIIGEAVKRIPEDIKKAHPEIPWKEMAGMRDKLIHAYFGVDVMVVWRTVKRRIPEIKASFEKIREEIGD